jgi:hypothetical protein
MSEDDFEVDEIEEWMREPLKKARSSNAHFLNKEGYNLSIRDKDSNNRWTWKLEKQDKTEDPEYSDTRYHTENDAKRAGLMRLREKLRKPSSGGR